MRGTKLWTVTENSQETIQAFAKTLGISPVLACLLLNRGLRDEESAQRFLNARLKDLSDPFLLHDMQKAVDRTLSAITNKESIVLYGDYDVDGVTSVAMMKRVLEGLGASNVRPFLPARFDEGYGLTAAGVEKCMAEQKPRLLIVLDCGTNSKDEVAALQKQGVDVIILDHHEPSDPAKPLALINYKLNAGKQSAVTEYCTAGLVFKFSHALLKVARQQNFENAQQVDLKICLDLVALATVADLAPLIEENRILVRHGLQQMAKTTWPGLKALMRVSGVAAEPGVYDCGFRLGPRLNASGRLESAMASLQLLMCDDEDEAETIARQLDAMNRERQAEEARVWLEARQDAEKQFQNDDTRVLVVARAGWHEGVVGIVASRITREFHLPTFVVALNEDGMGKGSGRSIEGFNLVKAVDATRKFLLRGGGHAMAAGVSLEKNQIDAWRNALQLHAFEEQGLKGERLKRVIRTDIQVNLSQLSMDLWTELQKLEPCGMGNPKPQFLARDVELSDAPKTVGADKKHLKLWLRNGSTSLDAIAFGWGGETTLQSEFKKGGRLDFVFELERNEYNGNIKIQLNIKDIDAKK